MPRNPELFTPSPETISLGKEDQEKKKLLQAVEEARDYTVEAKTLQEKVVAWRNLARKEAEAGIDPEESFSKAKAAAAKQPGLSSSSSYENIAEAEASLERFDSAKDTASLIKDREFKAQAITAIGRLEAIHGLLDKAKETIRTAPDKRKRSFAYSAVAHMQVDSDDLAGALETAKLVEAEEIKKPLPAYLRKRDKEHRSEANFPREKIEKELKDIKEGDNYKYHQLALAAAKAGHFDLAKEACIKIIDLDYRAAIERDIEGIEKGKSFWDKFRVKK